MATETQIVNEFVREIRKRPNDAKFSNRNLRWEIQRALTRDDLRGGYWFRGPAKPERAYMAGRIERRIRKKLGQPFRRKDRGPLRRRAAGKTEVTRRG
jgi:hypothetical protein